MEKRLTREEALAEGTSYLKEAVQAKKCWSCGCFHAFLNAIDLNYPEAHRPQDFAALINAGRDRLSDVQYDCLGCELCYPPTILNTLELGGVIEILKAGSCFTEKIEEREGWPPLPGSYRVLRYHAPVAVCTLTDEELASEIAQKANPELAVVGSLQTENIGIERLVQNVLANPNIRFLVVCGTDSRKAVGHLPGQSLVALAQHGLDGDAQIIEARGKRPFLHNISNGAVEHFRTKVEVVDCIGTSEIPLILGEVKRCGASNPGPSEPFTAERSVKTVRGHLPRKMVPDPAGYCVIYVDQKRGMLALEHYRNNGLLDVVIEGRDAAELYIPAIDQGLVSRLDHACYLGRELARAEQALVTGDDYVQDAAPEQELVLMTANECSPACNCKRSIL